MIVAFWAPYKFSFTLRYIYNNTYVCILDNLYSAVNSRSCFKSSSQHASLWRWHNTLLAHVYKWQSPVTDDSQTNWHTDRQTRCDTAIYPSFIRQTSSMISARSARDECDTHFSTTLLHTQTHTYATLISLWLSSSYICVKLGWRNATEQVGGWVQSGKLLAASITWMTVSQI